MHKYLPIIPFLIFATFQLFAQENYQSGYIIKNNGDTIRGEIDNKYWRKSPDQISFKQAGSTKIAYEPKDIHAFRV
ncbi:MAG: hypothetical protein AAGI07_16390, partial [Bacteroidota bacterium]